MIKPEDIGIFTLAIFTLCGCAILVAFSTWITICLIDAIKDSLNELKEK